MRLFLLVQAVLAVCLLAVAVGPQAASAAPPVATIQADANLDEEAEAEVEWESEEEGEEDEEEDDSSGTAGPAELPPECVLTTVRPSVVTLPGHDLLRLTLRYTAEEPTRVGVEYWLKGGKGSLQLGAAKRQLGRQGVLRLSSQLDEHELAKVRAARIFLIRLDVPDADPYCKRFLTFRLAAGPGRASRLLP